MATKPAKAKFVIALTPPKKPRRLTKADTSPKLVCCICSPKASTFCILSYCSLPNINSNDSFVLGLSKPKDFFKALKIRKKYNDNLGLISSYTHLGEFYKLKNIKKSIDWFNEAIKVSKALKNPRGELDALKFLMHIQDRNIKIKTRYITLSDSLQKQALKVKTQFAKIQYDYQLKNKELERFKTLSANQKLEVLVQRRQKTIYLLLGFIICIVAVFFTSYLIQKHKKDKVLEAYKTEKLISKRIHDEIANDISVVCNFVGDNINLQNVSKIKVLEDKLQNIYLRARDISTNISGINLSDFKKEVDEPYNKRYDTNVNSCFNHTNN